MALKALLEGLVQTAIATTDDLRTTFDYHSVTVGTYDPATDALSSTEVVVSGVQAVGARLTESENDFVPADANMQKMIIAALDLPGVTPKTDDYLMIGSEKWEVMKNMGVPGDSVYILKIRKP